VGEDCLSKHALTVLPRIQKLLPSDVTIRTHTVTEKAEVLRVPCLLFKVGKKVVYKLEGEISEDRVLVVLRLLS